MAKGFGKMANDVDRVCLREKCVYGSSMSYNVGPNFAFEKTNLSKGMPTALRVDPVMMLFLKPCCVVILKMLICW